MALTNPYSKSRAFPWLSLEDTNKIREQARSMTDDPYEQTLIQDDLYKKRYNTKAHEDFMSNRQGARMELRRASTEAPDWKTQNTNNSLDKMGILADMYRQYGFNHGKNWDNIPDDELVSRFNSKNPQAKKYADSFLTWNGDSEYELARNLWIVGTPRKKEEIEETFGQKVADVGVWILQSPWKRGYNMIWQWMDKLWKAVADKLEWTDLQKWVQEKAIEAFWEDEVRAFQEANKKAEEEWTLFNGREATDIRTPLLWEERANNKYTKAWEVIGDIATWIAMTAPMAAATAPIYASSTALWAGILWAGEWALWTAISHYGSQWDLNITPTEAALWIGGWVLWWEFTRYLSRLPKNQADNVRKEAEQYINKSIKPTVKWKMNQADYDKFIDDTMDVVNLMDKNKWILQYTDDAWNAVKWQMPTNMRETAESLWNLKKIIYDQYNEIAKQAWDAWARVNMNNAFQQLDDLSKDISQNIANPQTQNIIDSYKNALLQYTDDAGTIAIEDAQKLTQDFNKQLTAFFKNPNMNDVSRNSIIAQLNKWTKDAINDSIDDVLDGSIKNGSSASSQYTQLKSFYGKIKTIEDEISKRALVEARKNAKGLSSTILDSLSWWELTSAVLSLDPVKAGKAWVMNLISRYYNYVNNPNTQLNNLFKLVERTNNPTTTQTITQWIKNTVNQWVRNVAQQVAKPNVVASTTTALENNSEE